MERLIRSTTSFLAAALLLAVATAPGQPPGHAPGDAGSPPPLTQTDFDAALNTGPQGTLTVRAVQGTKGAPAVGEAEVELILYHRNKPVWTTRSVLDQSGAAVFKNIPIMMQVRPVVQIKYAGVRYQEVGPAMDAAHPEASMDVTVYELTDDAPAWKVTMRHIVASRHDAVFQVSETVVVENPDDKTWMGLPADAQGRRATVVLSVPEHARDVHLDSGFHGWCCTAVSARDLAIQMPLMPGKATYKFGYQVPVTDGRVALCVGASAPTEHAMFLVPDDATAAEPVHAEPGGVEAVGAARVRIFKAGPVQTREEAGLVLTGLVTPTQLATTTDTVSSTKRVTAIVAVALLALGLGVVLLRARAKRNAAF